MRKAGDVARYSHAGHLGKWPGPVSVGHSEASSQLEVWCDLELSSAGVESLDLD